MANMHEQPSSAESKYIDQAPKIIHFENLEIAEITLGSLIDNVPSLEAFTDIVRNFKKRLVSRLNPNHYIGGPYHMSLGQKLEDDQHKVKFFGKTENYRALVVPPRKLSLIQEKDKTEIDEERIMTFLAIRDAISTGRGNIGSITSECTIYLGSSQAYRPSGKIDDYNSPIEAHLLIRPVGGRKSFEKILEDSNIEWAKQRAAALAAAYPGGLPTLGKR